MPPLAKPFFPSIITGKSGDMHGKRFYRRTETIFPFPSHRFSWQGRYPLNHVLQSLRAGMHFSGQAFCLWLFGIIHLFCINPQPRNRGRYPRLPGNFPLCGYGNTNLYGIRSIFYTKTRKWSFRDIWATGIYARRQPSFCPLETERKIRSVDGPSMQRST